AAPLVALFLFVPGKRRPDRRLAAVGFVLFTAVFPVAYVILTNANVYDGWRHLYFVYPPLVAVIATAWTRLFARCTRAVQVGIALFLVLAIGQPLAFMARNRPLEEFYFSPLIGGIKGAFKKYEIDYYGVSLRPAIEWLAADAAAEGAKG